MKTDKSRPTFILMNHTSFGDVMMSLAHVPWPVLWHIRTYMAGFVLKMPILSTFAYWGGHFPVYFLSDSDGVFKVDREKMEATEKLVDDHLNDEGAMAFFPEGQVNKNPQKILPLRRGGMKRALKFNARLVLYIFNGIPTVWPGRSKVGGMPGNVNYTVEYVAPDGACAFVNRLREERAKQGKVGDKEVDDVQLLCEHLQELMQLRVDTLGKTVSMTDEKASSSLSSSGGKSWSAPFLLRLALYSAYLARDSA